MFGSLRGLLRGDEASTSCCGCEVGVDGATVSVDAGACDHDGTLARSPSCRARTIATVGDRDVAAIRTVESGRARDYRDVGPALVSAAARFATVLADDEPRLARRARRDPLGAAVEAAGRAGQVATVARDAGLARFASGVDGYDGVFTPSCGPAISEWRVDPTPPPGGRLDERRCLDTGATVRVYDPSGRSTRVYHLEPREASFDATASRVLAEAYEHMASTPLSGDGRVPVEAVRAVAGDDVQTATVARVLRKHCHECGLLRDLFADPTLSDAFVTAPARRNSIRVRVDGETLDTNVTVTDGGVAALASRFRRESGRGFSRAQPTLDAATTIGDRRVRVAGVTEPVTDGQAFAFRAHDRDVWTLPELVANGTLTPAAAGLLSVCVERGTAALLAGPRGSGKTTALGALLWEIPGSVRTVVIEDTPELPVQRLQAAGRDVQGLRTEPDGALGPADALRSALRLGDGALVVGEVRGEEACVLYEAMRVGANSEAVLGTIHGDGGDEVFERVVSDLGVPASSFGATALVVSLETTASGAGTKRRVRAIEEVLDAEPGTFATLFERTGDGLVPTGRIDRGNSRLVATLASPEESYADARAVIRTRATRMEAHASTGATCNQDLPGVRSGRDR